MSHPRNRNRLHRMFEASGMPAEQLFIELICDRGRFSIGMIPEVLAFCRRHTGMVWARISPDDVRAPVLAKAKVPVVGISAAGFGDPYSTFVARARRFDLRSYVHGLGAAEEAALARKQGYDFVSGDAVGQAVAAIGAPYAMRAMAADLTRPNV